ncbi:MAG: hypothetical protein ACYTGR_14070 [Planctomycetota bacterium]|jgi:hypothetical protein
MKDDHGDDRLFDALGDVGETPDLSNDILGRLGLVQVPESVSRRRRFIRFGNRIAMSVAAVLLIGLAVRVHHLSADAGRPAGLTIPSALENEIQRTQNGFNSIRSFRHFGPPVAPKADETPAPKTDDQAIAPVRVI